MPMEEGTRVGTCIGGWSRASTNEAYVKVDTDENSFRW